MKTQELVSLFESIESVKFGLDEEKRIQSIKKQLDYQLTPHDIKGKPELEKYLLNTLLFAAEKQYIALLDKAEKAEIMKKFITALLEAGADADKVVNDYNDRFLIISPYAYAILINNKDMIDLMDKYHTVHNLSNLHTKKRSPSVSNINFANPKRKERKNRASKKKELGKPV